MSAQIRSQFDADPSPTNTGDLALAYLLTGDAEKGARLAELRVLEGETAESLVDLSASQLERAISEGAADQFARAYDSALRALRMRPASREALFNRAMAVEGMGLAWIARQAWDEYLATESEGPWAEVAREARSRAARSEAENDQAAKDRPRLLAAWEGKSLDVVRQISRRRPDLARELLRSQAVPAVAREKLEGRFPGHSLAVARELNELAEASDGDTLDREALASLEKGDAELAAAHIEFAGASRALDDRNVDVGAPGIVHSFAVFKRKGSPYAAQAELQEALVDFFLGKRDRLIARYSSMLERHQGKYPLLRARAHWMRALCHGLVDSDRWQALLDNQEAFRLLTNARQRDSARQVAVQLSASLEGLGRQSEADTVLAGVVSMHSLEDPPLKTLAFVQTLAHHLLDHGLKSAALEIRQRAAISNNRGGAMVRAHAALEVVGLALDMNEPAIAARSLDSAARSLGEIQDREIRAEMEILYGLAALDADHSSRQAGSPDADRLVSALRVRRNESHLSEALTLRAEKEVAEGNRDVGEASLREALRIHIGSRLKTVGEFERIKQFEGAERPADDLVSLLSATGRPDEALALIESLRSPGDFLPGPADRVASALPAGEAVLSYWLLNDRLLATLLTAEGARHLSLPVRRASVASLVQRLKVSIELDSEPLAATVLSELYQALLAPLTSALGATHTLVIVPDRELWDVPFAGLTVRRGGPPFASHCEIAFSTSLSELMRSHQVWTKPRSILAVGDPSWDKARFGELARLPESLNEARGVAALYGRSRVLSGTEATRTAVQRLAPQFEVVHIATHAVGNDRNPGESFVLLAAQGSDPGMWRASDPGWNSLSRARLIVLSACHTGSQRSRFGGASLGVLRSIQSATRAQVLASTGDVDDAASRRLLEAFHRNLQTGKSPAAALRQAQLDAYKESASMTWMLYRIVV